MAEKDVEASRPQRIPHFKQVIDQSGITPDIEAHKWRGSGTEEDPYVVTWIDDDPRNPQLYGEPKKWTLTMSVAIATLAVAFVSSAYSGGAEEVIREFGCSQEIYTLGISLFVLGFAVGPLLWAPLSELFGRQYLFTITYMALTAFNAGAAGAKNIQSLIILRFFAGAFGSSPLTNAGGVIADMFGAKERGIALAIFAAAPFLGPVIGPIVGGFVGETVGWRWVEGVMAIFTGVIWIVGTLIIPETYPPVLLRARAKKLTQMTGKVHKSQSDIDQGPTTFGQVFKTSLMRPWVLLFKEPIVLLLSTYMAIIYGTLYMCFGAFPIVYQQVRGWSPGIGGLAFLGVAVGMIFAVAYAIWDNKRYIRIVDEHDGFAPAEARLPPVMIGAIALPIGLFWFAWTNYKSIHWIVSIIATVPFGFGLVLVFLGLFNYLIDSYTIFAASVLAANSVLRSLFGAAFPLFTTQMYSALGIHWASSIPAFLALACVPAPFLFYKYGPAIRSKCKFAAQSEAFMKKMQAQMQDGNDDSEEGEGEKTDRTDSEDAADKAKEHEEEREEEEAEAMDYSYEDAEENPGFRRIRTNQSRQSRPSMSGRRKSYDANPFHLDRVNTRESFKYESRSAKNSTRSRASSTTSKK